MAACSVGFSEALATAEDERRRAIIVPATAHADPEVGSLLRTASSRMSELTEEIAIIWLCGWS
eukprot:10147294-Lingulodinium_polyedra.AAC.1